MNLRRRRIGDELPEHPLPEGRYLDARLQLLDRQLLDPDDHPVGIVDDLELSGLDADEPIPTDTPPPRVSGILSGNGLATRILGGAPPPTRLQVIPWRLVSEIDTVVRLHDTDTPFDALWVEHWLRDHVIARIPGGRHADQ
jgi:hypothetical protein